MIQTPAISLVLIKSTHKHKAIHVFCQYFILFLPYMENWLFWIHTNGITTSVYLSAL